MGLSACSSATPTTTTTPTPVALPANNTPVTQSPSPSTSSSPSATPTASSSGSPAQALSNPCQVLTRAEASALSGVSMPAGVKKSWGTAGFKCGYTSGSVEAFVILEQAASPGKATAEWNAEKASLQKQAIPAGVKISATVMPGLGDRAELFVGSVTSGGVKSTMMAVFVLKGSTFVDVGDFALLGTKPPTASALKAQAATCVSRV